MIWVVRFAAVVGHLVLTIAASLAGVPIVGLLACCGAITVGRNARGELTTVWSVPLAWPWGNLEDGVVPPATVNGRPYLPRAGERWRAFVWCAVRNKASNLRFAPGLGFRIDPPRVGGVGSCRSLYVPPVTGRFAWSLAWQGPYCGLWLWWRRGLQFRIGWTIVPADADGFEPANLRHCFCGFSLQLNAAS